MTRQFIDLSEISKAEARVLIAQDVLNQLNLKKIIATSGTYFAFEDVPFDEKDFLHEVLDKTQCQVCALGSLYYSRVQVANETRCDVVERIGDYEEDIGDYEEDSVLNNINSTHTIMPDLNQYFDWSALDKIENYFEGWFEGNTFYSDNPDPEIRMRKIMQNIIDNNGDFKPELL